MTRVLSILAVVMSMLLGPGLARATDGEPRHNRDPALERLLARVQSILEREGVPGAGIALVDREGLVFAGGVGWADVDQQQSVQADTLFRVGSITKSVVALGVARLTERRVLDLDRPVSLPGIVIGNPHRDQPITLAHLLEHTAGFDDMHFNETFGPVEVERLRLEEVLAVNPRSRVARWEPGSRFSYANPGYTVAAAAIEHATGAPFEEVLAAEVLGPLGMVRARFVFDPSMAGRLATGYDGHGRALPYQAILHRPAGSLIASPLDLARVVEMWVRRGKLVGGDRFLHEETLARIERSGTLPFDATDVDYGLGNYGDVLHPVRSRGHDGGLPGFLSTVRYFPELDVGYVLLLNATHSARAWVEIRMLLFEYLARDTPRPRPPRADIPREALEQHVGHWEFASPRHAIFGFLETLALSADVELEGDQLALRVRALELPIPLLPTGPGRFRFPGQSGTSVQFARDRHGGQVMTLQNLYFVRGSKTFARARESGLRVAWVLLQSAVVSFVVLLVLHLIARVRGVTDYRAELRLLFPFALGTACLLAAAAVALGTTFEQLGTLNLRTVAICILPLAFASSSIAGGIRATTALLGRGSVASRARLGVRLHAATVSLAAVGLTAYLAYHHLVGLRTWSW